jgi:hypothetical protein
MTASVEVGGYNPNYVNGDLHKVESWFTNYWNGIANGVYYDGKLLPDSNSNSGTPSLSNRNKGDYQMAIFDTGTSFMVLSQTILDQFYPSW